MGLLDAAENKNHNFPEDHTVTEDPQQLDEAGITLRDRILRIPEGSHKAYTALSLIRAYGAFQSGTFFLLEEGSYNSYASVGLGIKKFAFTLNQIFSQEKISVSYFKFSTEEKQAMDFLDPGMDLWCFPLDRNQPWGAVLLLECGGAPSFNPKKLSLLLNAIQKIIHPGMENIEPEATVIAEEIPETGVETVQEPETDTHIVIEPLPELLSEQEIPDEPVTAGEPDVIVEPMQSTTPEKHSRLLTIMEEYFQGNDSLDGLLIKMPAELLDEETNGFNKIQSMVAHFAIIETIFPGCFLLLFPEHYDCNLIAHRLKNSLKADIPITFNAKNHTEAFALIQSFV